ncbi:hypothetical protein LH128_07207 [Sphingomonas sp. LH128]|nr:hypothetical protein LH128_07207 [Sphingomonas sp. LH128]
MFSMMRMPYRDDPTVAVARCSDQRYAATMEKPEDAIAGLSVVLAIVQNLNMRICKDPMRIGNVDSAFSQNLPALRLVIFNPQ